MKFKRKSLTIGLSLVALSGVAALSGTFAWFTTNRTASLHFNDATIRNRSGNLNVNYVSSMNTMLSSETTDSFGDAKIDLTVDKSVEDAKFVTDISGDGLDFYKVSWSGVKNYNTTRLDGVSQYKAGEINEVKIDNVGDADGYLIDFTLKISRDNKGEDHGLLVYLGEGTRILPKVENLSDYTDTLDVDNNVVESAYTKYYRQQMKNINGTKSARLAVNDAPLQDPLLPAVEQKTKFVYAQDKEIYEEVVLPPGEVQDGEYMHIEAKKDVDGNLIDTFSAYGFNGYSLVDTLEVRDGRVNELAPTDVVRGKEITVLGDPSVSGEDVRYDFLSGFKSYQNKAEVDAVILDDDGVALPSWQQPYNYGLISDLATDNVTEEYVNFKLWIEGTDVDAQNDVIGGVFTLELDIYTVDVLKN